MVDVILPGAIVAALLIAVTLLAFKLKKLQSFTESLQEKNSNLEVRLKNIEAKLEFVATGSKGMGQRLMSAEKKLNHALEKQDEMLSNNSEKLFQMQAERVLKQAVKIDDDSSPTRSEAKLMALVGTKPKDKN